MKRVIIYLCVLLFLGLPAVWGANEIRAFCPGATACFSVVREIDGDVWYVTGEVFEVWGTAARTAADYDIALTDKSGGMFVGTMDTNIGAGYYYILTYQQAGGSPADTDPVIWQEYGYWTGSVWQPYNFKTIEDKVDIIAVDVAGLDGEAMRGTDGVSLVVPDAAGTAAGLHGVTDGLIGGLVVPDAAGTAAALHTATAADIAALADLSADDAQAAAAAALAAYDPATRAEATADKDEVLAGLDDITVDNAAIADAVLDEIVEGAITLRQSIRLFLSMMTGKTTGGGTTRIKYRDIGDTKDRIDINVDSRGNRTKINTRDGL